MWKTNYLPILRERKEMAFLKWMRSRYSDFEAHDKYIYYYNILTRWKY